MARSGSSSGTEQIVGQLRALATPEERAKIERFYKGDDETTSILGVRMRETFDVAKQHRDVDLSIVVELLGSSHYEARMAAVSILDVKARQKRLSDVERGLLYETYMEHHDRIDNWDLVDRAAPHVVGRHLQDKSRKPLYELARSSDPWRRRTAITSTLYFCRFGQASGLDDVFGIASLMLDDEVELVAKAVGIALKYAADLDPEAQLRFLRGHAPQMARVTLRFASERLAEQERRALRDRAAGHD